MARHWGFVVAVLTVSVAMFVGTRQTHAAGYWNMPGNYGQRTGHGYGGGYHAPFMLGPIKADGWGPPNEVRLRCAPSPYCGCYCNTDCENFDGCGCRMNEPTVMDVNVEAQVAPPTSVPVAQQIDLPPPVEQQFELPPAIEQSAGAAPLQSLFDAPVQP